MRDILLAFLSIVIIVAFTFFVVFLLNKYIKKNGVIKDLVIAVAVASIVRWGFFEISTVPTGSMEGTILPGDFTFVSKLHYGPRTPQTLLQVPLTHQKTRLLELKSYLNFVKLPTFRFKGFTNIKRGDVVVFNTPSDKGMNMDMKTFYVKRCIGLPGENIEVRDNNVFINGENIDNYPNRLFHFLIESNKILSKSWFYNNNIHEFRRVNCGVGYTYLFSTTLDNIEKLKNHPYITSLEPYHEKRENIFITNAKNYKSNSNWGPIWIPKKGEEIDITSENIKIYGYAIELDSKGKIKFNGDKLLLKNKEIKKYKFQQNHYFMMGDNRCNSADSRFWGFVPEDHIYAKTICILFSKKPDSWLSGLSFKRFFKFL